MLQRLGLIVLLNLLVKPGWLLAEQLVQDQLGHALWGRYTALVALAWLLRPLGNPGVANHLVRAVAANPRLYAQWMGAGLGLAVPLNMAYALVVLGAAVLLGLNSLGVAVLAGVVLWHVLLNLQDVLRAGLQGQQQFTSDGLLGLADKLVLLGLVLGLLALPGFELELFVAATLASMASACLATGLLLWLRLGPLKLWQPASRWGLVLRHSLPFAWMTVLFSAVDRLLPLLLEQTAGPEATGLYAASWRWVAAAQMYLWTVLPIFFARFARLHTGPPAAAQASFNTALLLAAAPVVLAALLFVFHGDQLFFLFSGSSAAQRADMQLGLQVLAGVLLLNGLFNVFSTWLTATGHTAGVNRLMLWALLGCIPLALWLLPVYGPLGAAGLAVGMYAFLSGGYVRMFVRRTALQVPWRLLAALVGAAGGAAGVLAVLRVAPGTSCWTWWSQSAAGGAAYALLLGALLLLLRAVPRRGLNL